MTKEDIQRVLELALEYYKLEVFGTGKESENPNQERIDWIYDRMKEEQVNRLKLSDNLEEEIAGMYQALFGTDVINHKERLYLDTFEAIARHFALWQKNRMMKDAVECVVCAGKEGGKWIMTYIGSYESMLKACQTDDKVHIIIVMEDKK